MKEKMQKAADELLKIQEYDRFKELMEKIRHSFFNFLKTEFTKLSFFSVKKKIRKNHREISKRTQAKHLQRTTENLS